MRNVVLISVMLGILLMGAMGMAPSAVRDTPTTDKIRAAYQEQLSQLQDAAVSFQEVLDNSTSGPVQWRDRFQHVRYRFKMVEFLLAYLEEEAVRDYLNGPPLPWVNRVIPGVVVEQPQGLQVIEEMLYDEDVDGMRTAIRSEVASLLRHLRPVINSQKHRIFTDREVFEAIRSGILRVAFMGITGFDTPGSGAGLAESAIAMEAMQNTLSVYAPYLQGRERLLLDTALQTFRNGVDMLWRYSARFDDFDRLSFTRDYVDPLYGQVLGVHLALGVETIDQVPHRPSTTRYDAPSIFQAKAFNTHYYAGVGASEESASAVSLGRLLFFDPLLSSDNERACASCHHPEKGFTDGFSKSISTGFKGNVGRNAPSILNSVLADKYFYDLRADRLDTQADHVIFNPLEFSTSYNEIIDKLSGSMEYLRLFEQAFGGKPDHQTVSRALAAYVRSLVGFNSEVDRYIRREIDTLPHDVQLGYNLFMGKALCGTCHFGPVFSGLVPPYFSENESEVIGVPARLDATIFEIDPDEGRFNNGVPRDRAPHLRFSFKTPSVRNVSLTPPYMHNGVYRTLEEVVDFYNRGGGLGLGIDLPHQTLPPDSLHLTATEQKALVAFMQALTDTSGMTFIPERLPTFEGKPTWNARKIGGTY
jgi:cytochrome c peroxidase